MASRDRDYTIIRTARFEKELAEVSGINETPELLLTTVYWFLRRKPEAGRCSRDGGDVYAIRDRRPLWGRGGVLVFYQFDPLTRVVELQSIALVGAEDS